MPEPPEDWLKWINGERMPKAQPWEHPMFGNVRERQRAFGTMAA